MNPIFIQIKRMPYIPLLTALAKLFKIEEKDLQERLNHPDAYIQANRWLTDKRLRTNYLNKSEEFHDIVNGQITLTECTKTFAYEGFLDMLFTFEYCYIYIYIYICYL